MRLPSPGCRIKLKEGILQGVVQFHYCSLSYYKLFERRYDVINTDLVTTAVTIVWCREDCDDISIMRPVVSFHYKLVSSGHQSEAVGVVECL